MEAIDRIHDSPDYKAVWTLYWTHGGHNAGPMYDLELAAAREALKGDKSCR